MSKTLKRLEIGFANKSVNMETSWRINKGTSFIYIIIRDGATGKVEFTYRLQPKDESSELELVRF